MRIDEVPTPAWVVDFDILEDNIAAMAALCRNAGKALWPMVKTHKSSAIARMQLDAGAAGFLTGTLDEAETLAGGGMGPLILAYPVAGAANVARVARLARQTRLTVSFDGEEAAAALAAALDADVAVGCLVIVDSGLGRFGVPPAEAGRLASKLSRHAGFRVAGVATHPGHVYGVDGPQGVSGVAADETAALRAGRDSLRESGFEVRTVAAGSTPTAAFAAADEAVTAIRPGNYVFYDAMQTALGVATPERCALTVHATVLSRPRPGVLIVDAGSKCLGLDKGAHGNALLPGYGTVQNNPGLTVTGLSEEVGRIAAPAGCDLAVGDRIAIIPNHACAAANMTSFLIGCRDGRVEKLLPVDMRGGLRPPHPTHGFTD